MQACPAAVGVKVMLMLLEPLACDVLAMVHDWLLPGHMTPAV
jgi:hypothetical protein